MAKFVFQLEGVLRYRHDIERQRQRDVAVIQGEMAALQNELQRLTTEVQTSNQETRDHHLRGRLDMAFISAHRRYIASAQRQVMVIAQKMAAVQVRLEAARKLLLAAARDFKAIEKLREKHLDAWNAEIHRKENIALDEVAMQMSYRNDEYS
jgi:flagellar export protein FliJ